MSRTCVLRALPSALVLLLLPLMSGAMCFFGSGDLEVRVLKVRDALVPVPEGIRTLALVNRAPYTGPEEASLEAALSGVSAALADSPFFKTVGETLKAEDWKEDRRLSGQMRRDTPCETSADGSTRTCRSSTGVARMMAPMPAKDVVGICQWSQADGLVSLEVYVSNRDTMTDRLEYTEEDKNGTKRRKTEYSASAECWKGVGWRLYDCRSGYVIDEYHQQAKGKSTAPKRKDSEKEAIATLKDPIDASSFGRSYAARISPLWTAATRSAYCSGDSEIKRAFQDMEKGRFEQAEQLLTAAVKSSKSKERGHAAHNIAICREARGDLEGALEQAKLAGKEKDSKKTREYVEFLESRIALTKRLERLLPPSRFQEIRAHVSR